jgi:hypothetical protein
MQDRWGDAHESGRPTVLGSYPSCVEAERAVDHLADNGSAVEHTAISGHDPSSYEPVTGRRAARQGAGPSAHCRGGSSASSTG